MAAKLAVIVLLVTPGATSKSAAAEGSDEGAVRFSGEWTLVGGVIVPIDPEDPTGLLEDPTGPLHFKAETASLLFGDFVGVDNSSITGTFDPQTGELKGRIRETVVSLRGVRAHHGARWGIETAALRASPTQPSRCMLSLSRGGPWAIPQPPALRPMPNVVEVTA